MQILGYFGAFLTCVTFMPQVYKSWQSKSVGDLSMYTILIVMLSTVVWFIYGVGINEGPVIIANGITFLLSVCLFIFKLRFKK